MITKDEISSDLIYIDAPVNTVWDILIDFKNYGRWNPFCPQAEAKLEIGFPIKMIIDLGLGQMDWVEYITLIEPNHKIAWGLENKAGDPFNAIRTQSLIELSDSRCSYISVDKFWGDDVTLNFSDLDNALAHQLRYTGTLSIASGIENGFNSCARGLKQYAEKLCVGFNL
jgi:hypothetical protein